MDLGQILSEIRNEIEPFKNEGQVASYIPELAKINPEKYGVHISTVDGRNSSIGDYNEKFSIQSITKVFSTSLAFSLVGEDIWKRVGVEPAGTKFNSLIRLETENGIPQNPFINAGALVIADILITCLKKPKEDYLNFIRKISGVPDIHYNFQTAKSEMDHGFRNAALVNFMKSFNNIHNDVHEVLDFYMHMCSLEMTCAELSAAFLLYCNQGHLVKTDEQILTKSQTKRMNALMQTCGFYDETGEFTFKVGLPGKSGVGGGIAAVHPREYSVAVWSPKLNHKGNSVLGMKTLELLTTKSGLSIF
ncbi:MAG TPA: glutaminase [Cytophagaceae bacterium]|jgi:glutaminase|nr:glutaminase [Cytophagaceae bacterium]